MPSLLLGILVGGIFLISKPVSANEGINGQINFQGRLLTAEGATAPDGYYNLEFKIYVGGDGQSTTTTGTPSGTAAWTEDYLNSNGNGVTVKNGFMSVQLGSVNAFGSSINWNDDTLWLSVTIGNTDTACATFSACAPDTEMVPMKRLSASPYALNSELLNGIASSNFVQIAQGVQTDASLNTNSIFINKTGTGNILSLQANGSDAFTINKIGNVAFGANANHSITLSNSAADTAGNSLTVSAGTAGTGVSALAGGNLILQGGNGGGTNGNGGDISINGGTANGSGLNGNVYIGDANTNTIQVGNANLLSGTQTINIGTSNILGGTTNITIGNGSLATAGTTALQAKSSITISTNGVARGTFDGSGNLYLGNGVTATAPSNFTIKGTSSTTAAIAGGAINIQGGNATIGNTNGGNLVLAGGNGYGTGSNGLVVLATPTFSTTVNDTNCYTGGALVSVDCTIATNSIDKSAAVIIGFSATNKTAYMPDPTLATAGRVVYITAAISSNDFTLSVNGGGTGNQIAMRQNTTATMIWNGNDWTAAGASSSTTLQSAYDNTMQSAGGAELIVSHTSTTNGLTIRDSSTNPVDGNLLSVQTSSAAGLLSVNSNVTEYSSDGGAETAGGTSTTFPVNTWSSNGSAAVSRYVAADDYTATGQGSIAITTTTAANDGTKNRLTSALTANMHYNVSFSARLLSGAFTDMNVYYSIDGATASVVCAASQAAITSIWTKINCSFAAPSSGITANNAILIRQTGSGTARTFYIDNLSVTIAADYNLATDGGVNDATNFATNWSFVNATTGLGSISRNTSDGQEASDSASATITTGAANAGIRNKLSINPLVNTLYRVTVYAKLNSGTFNDFKVRYSRDGSTSSAGNYVDCVDYKTQVITTTNWTEITCYITTDSTPASNPYINFVETTAASRTFSVDAFSMVLSSSSTPNVQIGGGVNGGPVTLFTLDRAASAPIASNNETLLGSMYYDTSLGKLQCYEADGWGACGSSPDNVVTISPEYNNAVMHGTGVGTMTSDICSSTLGINDGTSGQATICGTNETYNFYKWTSPQASAQTYSIYVTYQLPSTFKEFASGETSIMGRTDSASSNVQYQVYRNSSIDGLTACGPVISVSTGPQSSWKIGTATGAADPSTCNFVSGDSIVFKIDVIASQNANAYVGNLNFIFSNR